jgi:3-oxoacyl-[acyl-carrier protein] reductase
MGRQTMSIRYDFSGKVVLVTGSSRGIGAGILEAFGQARATCIVNYFADPAGENAKDAAGVAERIKQSGGTPQVLECDVRSAESVAKLMQQIKETCGGLDILVNNAGIIRDKTLKKMAPEDWSAVIDTNLTGVFHCNKFGIEVLRDDGRIVNIASVAGLFPFPGQTNYAAAKAGVIAMTKVHAKELARRKITVNAIAPGIIVTPMLMTGIKPEMVAEYEKQIPLGRIGQPTDVANAVLFLAADESNYITGQVLPVTGGWF